MSSRLVDSSFEGRAHFGAGPMKLLIGPCDFSPDEQHCRVIEVSQDAMVDDVIAQLPESLGGCCGFFAVANSSQFDHYFFADDDEEDETTGLARALAADGGVLLSLGCTLASYGVDAKTSSDVIFFGVFSAEDKQPTVYREDLSRLGFGEAVYKYVKLQSEDKELALARRYFRSPLLEWLTSTAAEQEHCQQTIEFSMKKDYQADVCRAVLTVSLDREGDVISVNCTNLAGTTVLSTEVSANDPISALQEYLCEKLPCASLAFWNGSDRVSESDMVSKYSLLTADQSSGLHQLCGCYQYHANDVGPAGYSASGTSRADYIVLEPGKAGLQIHFKGDYKRAEELQKLTISDAQWSVGRPTEENDMVRIAGQAVVDRYWVHERSGSDGGTISQYECFCVVTIPVQQLLAAQTELYSHSSTEGSGWTCGSEDYKCMFYLPMPLLGALRVKQGAGDDTFNLQGYLNRDASPAYPYNRMTSAGRRFGGNFVCRLTEPVMKVLAHFRENLKGNPGVGIEEMLKLQASACVV